MANEIHNAEITNNQGNVANNSEQNPKNNVNNIAERYQDLSDVPIKPSDPSDPSANLDNTGDKGTDKKQDKEMQGTAVINRPENKHSRSTKTSTSKCPYCKQRFPSQSELIAHMDKESEDPKSIL
jgi:glutamate synthase domain-containing protein 1